MTAFILQLDGKPFPHALGKIVCVGRNYAAHAAELNNPVPSEPLLFIKPASAAAHFSEPVQLPSGRGSVHHELEMAVLIGAPLRAVDAASAQQAIAGIGLALDLTLREVQDKLKRDAHPWERSKAFDGAYPVSQFIGADGLDLHNLTLQLWRAGHLQQSGNTRDMLFAVSALIAEISHNFSLQPGDIVSTGTPAGVGPLQSGESLIATLGQHTADDLLRVEARVA
ncbi:MAG: isomerase/hydrolase [Verrucomicrobiaceae bacterium]|nr:isomerase/hydrolase [Verrucomicrobiaceae bacterium]